MFVATNLESSRLVVMRAPTIGCGNGLPRQVTLAGRPTIGSLSPSPTAPSYRAGPGNQNHPESNCEPGFHAVNGSTRSQAMNKSSNSRAAVSRGPIYFRRDVMGWWHDVQRASCGLIC